MQLPSEVVRVDVLELWVGDLQRTRQALARFGFQSTTPHHDDEVMLVSGAVRFSLRQGRIATSPVARYVARHGAGIADVALVTDEAVRIAARAEAAGLAVTRHDDAVRIDLLGDGTITHTLRSQSVGPPSSPVAVASVDHVTYCVPWGTLDAVARSYAGVFAMDVVRNDDCVEVGDLERGMRTTVLRGAGGFTIVLTEPRSPHGDGQTERFVRTHRGACVQHVALACTDLIATAGILRERGVTFLPMLPEDLKRSHARLRDRPLRWAELSRHGILVDADSEGLLFQLFTAPLVGPMGFFLELIERAGATGFGATNVSALYAAVDAALPSEVS
jgi:4-hydroxymandelate synthase